MSDSNRLVPGCYSQEEIDKDARIAELEAELKAWRKMIAQMDRLRLEQVARAEKAEAELAALRADVWGPDERRCDSCDSREGLTPYCLRWKICTPDAHSCKCWAERSTP